MLVYRRMNFLWISAFDGGPDPGFPSKDFRRERDVWCSKVFETSPYPALKNNLKCRRQNTKSSIIAWSYFSLGFMEHEAFAQAVQLLACVQCLIVETPSIVTHQQILKTQQIQNEVCNSWSFFVGGFHFLQLKEIAQQQIHPTRNGSKKWPLDQEVVHPLQVSLLVQSLGTVSYHQNGEKNSSHRLLSQGGVLCRKFRVGFCSTKTWKDGKGWVNWKVWEMGMCYSLFFADEIIWNSPFAGEYENYLDWLSSTELWKDNFQSSKWPVQFQTKDEVALVVLQMVDLFGRKCGEPCGFRILGQVGEPLNPFHWKRWWFHCYVIYLLKNFRMANFNPFEIRTGRIIPIWLIQVHNSCKFAC